MKTTAQKAVSEMTAFTFYTVEILPAITKGEDFIRRI